MIRVLAVSKSQKHCFFKLEKRQEFFAGFRYFLKDIGFGEYDVEVYSFGRPLDGKGEPNQKKEDDIKTYVDKRVGFDNGEYAIDVVFGGKSIFLIIFTKKDRQKEISEKLGRFCTF